MRSATSPRRVMGYELLYRRSAENWAPVDDPVAAISTVVSPAMLGFGLDHLVSNGLAFVNVTRDFLASGLHRVLPAVRLLASIERPDVSGAEMEAIIACEPGLAYRLLRLANSSSVGIPRPVTSLRDALVLLGRRTIKNLALVAMIYGVEGKTSELATTAMVRAKMCEQLAIQVAPASAAAAFLVGLLSVLDAVFDAPIAGLVGQLSLSEEISAALIDHQGQLGELLEVTVDSERGGRSSLSNRDLTIEVTLDAYVTAVPWADQTMAELARPSPATRRAAARAT